MKTKHILLFAVIAFAFVFSACGPAVPPQTTRQQQLEPTGILNKHPLLGASLKDGLNGKFAGGWFLFAGGANGQIEASQDVMLKVGQEDGSFFYATLPFGILKVIPTANQETPEIVFDFKDSWLESNPSPYFEEVDIKTMDGPRYFYTEGALSNPNNFLKVENLDLVKIYISPSSLKPSSNELP